MGHLKLKVTFVTLTYRVAVTAVTNLHWRNTLLQTPRLLQHWTVKCDAYMPGASYLITVFIWRRLDKLLIALNARCNSITYIGWSKATLRMTTLCYLTVLRNYW